MKKKDKNVIFMAIYSIVVIFLGALAGYFIYPLFSAEPLTLESHLSTPAPTASGGAEGDNSSEEVANKGKMWKVFSDTFDYNKETEEGVLYNVTCCFYEGEEEKIFIESERADIDFEQEIITFNSTVSAKTSKGERLRVDALIWDYKDNLALGEGNVRLLKENTLVKADRIEADITLSIYDLYENIQFIKSKERREGYEEDFLERTIEKE